MESKRFAGYGVVEFSESTRHCLVEVAEKLLPNQDAIVNRWISVQWNTWQPPGLSRNDLEESFRSLFVNLVTRLHKSELEQCLVDMEEAGRRFAERNFPFRALVVSVHYLEESYIRYLLNPQTPRSQKWLIAMDEFLHSVLAAIATSYFDAYRKELLDQAEVGRIVQEGLLAEIPRRSEDLEIAHVYVSARERAQLGGDFLDFFRVDSRGLAFLIGDLSGHGVEAAADSVMLRSLFRGFMREEPDLARAMQRTNKVLLADLQPDQFATALAATYHVSGEVNIVSAGHPHPIVCSQECRLIEVTGDALGVSDAPNYTVRSFILPPGGTFVAYTDGLIEARGGGVMFGEQGALEAAASMREASARAVAEHLVDSALRNCGGKFSDDVAVLVLKRRPSV